MLSEQELCQFFDSSLEGKYNYEQIQKIVRFILKSDYIRNITRKNQDLLNLESNFWNPIFKDLMRYRPIQYCLGEAYFMDLVLHVDERVLIPRPETEELVHWVIQDYKTNWSNLKVLDIGTGSGAIPIQLYRSFKNWNITAMDISLEALMVAEMNANRYSAPIHFIQQDFLQPVELFANKFDLIISNPPYISFEEKDQMSEEVLSFEPHLALFAEGDDPLIFYRRIAEFGQTNLMVQGVIYCELNEFRADDIVTVFKSKGYSHIELREDLQGKKRMIKVGF